ncbi:uncharacterized protein METZ01_LOCUS325848, partial [marine metagenome]
TGFDLSNNFLCPPYMECIENPSYQDTQNCDITARLDSEAGNDNIRDNRVISPVLTPADNLNLEHFRNDLYVLQGFIAQNESLKGQHPLEIGRQKWEDMRLVSLDLSDKALTAIPTSICSILPSLKTFDLSNNAICSPYPQCIEYIAQQDMGSCGKYACPDGYEEIDGECYAAEHIVFLQALIDSNTSLAGLEPLQTAQEPAYQQWKNGRLDRLILSGRGLTNIPESICSIYSDFSVFDISDNSICPSYPTCIENVGYQNTADCSQFLCLDGYGSFDESCYYHEDIQVLIDFTMVNPSIENYHPLMLGYQTWKDSRLQLLYLDGLDIIAIPESIQNLNRLKYLN